MDQLNKNVEKIIANKQPWQPTDGKALRLTTALSILHTGLTETACLPNLGKEQSKEYKMVTKMAQMLQDDNKEAWDRLFVAIRQLLVRNLPMEDTDDASQELKALTTSMCITPLNLHTIVKNPTEAVKSALAKGDYTQLAALYFIGCGKNIATALTLPSVPCSLEVALVASGLVGSIDAIAPREGWGKF